MVILEFANDKIKLIETVKKGPRVVLKNLAKKTIGGMSDEAIPGAVSDLLKETGIKKASPLIVAIPRHMVTVRSLRLPSADDTELRGMVSLQAGKQLPYPASELIWDFKVIDKRPDGYSDVFLAMAHRNVIDRFVGILAKRGLTADRIILSSEALFGWYIGISDLRPEDAALERSGAVIDIDSAYADIVILNGNRLEFSRSFPFKDSPEEMADEIRKTFLSYEKEVSRGVSFIVLTGIEERIGRLRSFIEAMPKTGALEFVHSLRILNMNYRETMSEYVDLSRDTSFSCLLGIACNFSSLEMDFLPPELKDKIIKDRNRKRAVKTAILTGALILLLFGVLSRGIIEKTAQLTLVNSKIKETAPQVKRLKEIVQNIEVIKKNLSMKGSSIDVIREVYKIVPQEASISVLDFELEKSLTIRGVSADLSSVFKFASNLGKSPYFNKCQIRYAQKRTVKEREFVDFEINCLLKTAPL